MNERFILNPLRFRHAHEPRETGPGFASRLAAMNGRLMGEMFQHMGIQPHAVDNGVEAAVRMVADLGDVDAERLLALTPKPVDGKREYHVAGEVLGPLGINRTFFRYCPHCVLEDLKQFDGPKHGRPWLRLEWTILHYRACHHHNVYLVDAQPVRRRFQPFDFSETMQGLLPSMETIAAETLPASPSRFEQWLVARTDGVKDSSNFLDTLPLYVAAQWCEALGVSALHPSKVQTSRITQQQWAVAADEGFGIAAEGKDAIVRFLRRMTSAERRTRGIIGPRDTYGVGYGLLQSTMDDPAYEPLRAIVRDYVMTAMPWEIGTDVLGVTLDRAIISTVRTLALASGVNPTTLRRVLRKKGLAKKDLKDGLRNHRVLLPAEQAETLASKLKGALTIPQTMEQLGVERRQVEALVEAGALVYATGVARDEWEHSRFAQEDVDAMMMRLLDGAIEIEEPNDRQVDIGTARHMAGATTVDVLKLIFENRLGWKGLRAGQSGYNAILLDVDEVTMLVRTDAPQFINLRFCDVETVVPGLGQRSIQPLIDAKKLVQTMEYSPNARREVPVVTAESARTFRETYVTAGELCQTHGLHHKQVKYRLLDAGVDMEFDQGTVKAMIYDRAKVERAAADRPEIWVA
ncbi:TniQ family protein [Devosia rhizoryzae]|uniref:TniQ family protein n=1 Tax=Devosia rhizoryzae TaxID=2774137 RepID=A0ABX7C5J3_9HYPH|nr:TniQ family protein [Devosia rhizoryzae]QQR39002.1 TniQ family protein [Devosia rhizoryzae]